MEIMVSGTPCYQLEGKLKNIEFMLYDTKIIIVEIYFVVRINKILRSLIQNDIEQYKQANVQIKEKMHKI